MLGVLLADLPSWPAARAHIDRALAAGKDTHIFLMDDAVRLAYHPELVARIEHDGLDATLCATDAARLGVSESSTVGPRFGSQHDHAQLVKNADTFLALTGAPAALQQLRGETRAAAITLDRKIFPGLRAAVGYLSAGITIELYGDDLLARAGRDEHVVKTLATLRGLGHVIAPTRATSTARTLQVRW